VFAPSVASVPRLSVRPPRQWERPFAHRVAATDVAIVLGVLAGYAALAYALDGPSAPGRPAVLHLAVPAVVAAAWIALLAAFATRDARIIGSGFTEYKRVVDATLWLFVLVAAAGFLADVDLSHGWLLVALAVGLIGLVAARRLWRGWLARQRAVGRCSSRALLVGSPASVSAIARDLARQPHSGYLVVGTWNPRPAHHRLVLPDDELIRRDLDDILELLDRNAADTVIVTGSDELTPERIRQLSWSLESGRQHLVMAPSLTDIGGPRIHTRPVAGLPLIHVETPRYEGPKSFLKRAFDIVATGMLVALLSPVLGAIALGVRLDSPGPVLFRQDRVGRNGERFTMYKFRSMVVDAEQRLADLQAHERREGNVVMFKMKNDPRVTRFGAFIRRFSLDELPQLFNVLNGSMSLVGPRPPLDREVISYETHVHRRFLVKPGITGLWQVSGRSNLSWEDTVRLDLYYVENWSIMGDLGILWRTARAVLASDGAY
jgi:exopolysaccharide biosynthesis polyprenyl glycosylphosphotransferase